MINKIGLQTNNKAFGAKLNLEGGGVNKDLCDYEIVEFIKKAEQIGSDTDKIDIYLGSIYKDEHGLDRNFETKAIIGNNLIRDNVALSFNQVLYSPALAIDKYLSKMAELFPKKD